MHLTAESAERTSSGLYPPTSSIRQGLLIQAAEFVAAWEAILKRYDMAEALLKAGADPNMAIRLDYQWRDEIGDTQVADCCHIDRVGQTSCGLFHQQGSIGQVELDAQSVLP